MSPFKKIKDIPFNRNTFLKCLFILVMASFLLLFIMLLSQHLFIPGSSGTKIIPLLYYIFVIIFVIIVSLLSAGFLTVWIEKSFKAFMDDVYEIGRGNFSIQFPSQKNYLYHRLAKLIHYMAVEMDRLRHVDVHNIISEKNKTEAILHNIADGVIVVDINLNILVLNSVAEKWFGYHEKQLIGKPLSELLRNQKLFTAFHDVINGQPETVAEFTYRIIGDVSEHIFQVHSARVDDESHKIIGVIAILRDVTKEREADRIKTELVSMVAHELKSPLTSIYGFSELLNQIDSDDARFRQYAQVIMSESTRLTDFVNKFLDLSRLESGRKEIKLAPIDLKHIALKVLEIYKSVTEKKNIRVITEFPEPMPLIKGDPDLIEQVIANLVNNAVKYSPDHSKIGIEVKPGPNAQVTFLVIDNGRGIQKDSLPLIFNKFYRVTDPERDEEIEGSGLGLALVKEIIERHGGTVAVQSRINVGSVFSFSLPKV
jgi:PAS domain S-box-containing protein